MLKSYITVFYCSEGLENVLTRAQILRLGFIHILFHMMCMEFQLDHRDHSRIFDGSAELIGSTDKHYLTSNIYLAIHSTNSSDLPILRMKVSKS